MIDFLIIFGFVAFFVAIAALVILIMAKNFLRFESVKDFVKLDEYLYRVEEDDLNPDIAEQYNATYKYKDNFIYLSAAIFKSKMKAARCFSHNMGTRKFIMYAAKAFIIDKNTKKNIRFYKKTFLFVSGNRGEDYNEFYKLVLGCLKTKSKHVKEKL